MGNKVLKPMGISEPHFVLQTSLNPDDIPKGFEHCVFATGCFWGAEKGFWRMPGMYVTAVGYAGGTDANPTYNQVCSGSTGHTEAVMTVWDPSQLSFVDVMRQFLQCHDPSQVNGQGNDRGSQYRGAFYYVDEVQHRIGTAAIEEYEKLIGKKIATEVKPLDHFHFAEQYHQQYLSRPGARPYCSASPLGINLTPFESWGPADLIDKFQPKLGEDYWAKHAPSPHCVLREPHEQIKWRLNSL